MTPVLSVSYSPYNTVSGIIQFLYAFLGQHRTKIVRQMRRQIFCQIVQKSCRQAVACQRIFVQDDGKYAGR
jgi:hypothetical protein